MRTNPGWLPSLLPLILDFAAIVLENRYGSLTKIKPGAHFSHPEPVTVIKGSLQGLGYHNGEDIQTEP
jgi:hypothetical protein